jgi:hypothetical protein
VSAGKDDLVLASEWVVSLWIPSNSRAKVSRRLVGEVSDALGVLAAELSLQPGCGAIGLDRRVEVEG